MLSFLGNKSTNTLFTTRRRLEFPDENYAREIMQLFTIGLTKLNNDGTPVLDVDGVPLQTYTNNEITEYARVWTGFRRQDGRGNIETKVGRKFEFSSQNSNESVHTLSLTFSFPSNRQ